MEQNNYKTLESDCEDVDSLDETARNILGSWGWWHKRMMMIAMFHGFFGFMHVIVFSLYVPQAEHWCKPPPLFSNWTEKEWKNFALPPSKKGKYKYSECYMYDLDYSKLPPNPQQQPKNTPNLVECKYGWDFDKSVFPVTIENEWDLVCSREVYAKTAASTFNFGILIGHMLFGQLSDMYGRRSVYLYSSMVGSLVSLLACFANSFWLFCTLRFFIALILNGGGMAGFILIIESVDTSMRGDVGMILGFSGSFGFMLLISLSYAGMTDWRHLQAFMTFGSIVGVIFLWFLPESFKWLHSQGRTGETYQVLKAASKVNGKTMPPEDQFHFKEAKENQAFSKRYTVCDFFRHPNTRKKTLNIFFNWFVNSFVYYGLTLGANSLGGDVFLNSFVSGAVEIPSTLLGLITLKYIGRRWNICLFMLVGGVACFATSFFQKGDFPLDWPIIMLANIGKFCISATFSFIYVFSAEIFPTVARNLGMGASSMSARIGSITAPYLDLLRHLHSAAPLIAYGTACIMAGLLILDMPETKDTDSPETMEEAERIVRVSPRRSDRIPVFRRFDIQNILKKRNKL